MDGVVVGVEDVHACRARHNRVPLMGPSQDDVSPLLGVQGSTFTEMVTTMCSSTCVATSTVSSDRSAAVYAVAYHLGSSRGRK
nr:unnamed protein product [Digitaria exilis]